MTVEALTGAHAGASVTGDVDISISGDDTYETARTFESLGVSARIDPSAGERRHRQRFSNSGHDRRRRPGRPRRLRQGQDRLGQDPRLRRPAAPASQGDPRPRSRGPPPPRPWRSSCSRPGSWPSRCTTSWPLGRRARSPRRRRLRRSRHRAAGVEAAQGGRRGHRHPGTTDRPRGPGRARRGPSIETLVLDEADRMADMGFMPQVEWVLRRLERAAPDAAVLGHPRRSRRPPGQPLPDRPGLPRGGVLALTTVEAMEHRFLQVHQMDRVKVVAAICRSSGEVALSSCAPSAAPTASWRTCSKEGVHAAAIHGDLRQANRERALADFSDGRLSVLVATDVAARGLHIEAVDGVIHFDPPEDHKAYLHRSGRTARAGKAGVVVSLALWNQLVEVEVIQRRSGSGSPSSRCSPTTRGWPTSPAWTPSDPRRASSERRDPRATPVWSTRTDGVRRVLVVTAHPDDVDFGSAGTVAAFTSAGVDVTYCIVTNGDAGGSDRAISARRHGGVRREEQRAAAAGGGRDRRDIPRATPTGWSLPASSCAATSAGSSARSGPTACSPSRPERNWDCIYASHPDHLAAGEAAVVRRLPRRPQPVRPPRAARGEGLEPWTRAGAVDHGARRGARTRGGGHDRRFERKVAALLCSQEPGR